MLTNTNCNSKTPQITVQWAWWQILLLDLMMLYFSFYLDLHVTCTQRAARAHQLLAPASVCWDTPTRLLLCKTLLVRILSLKLTDKNTISACTRSYRMQSLPLLEVKLNSGIFFCHSHSLSSCCPTTESVDSFISMELLSYTMLKNVVFLGGAGGSSFFWCPDAEQSPLGCWRVWI